MSNTIDQTVHKSNIIIILKWIFSVVLITLAISFLSNGSIVSFFCWLLASLLILPPVTKYLKAKHNFHIYSFFKFVAVLVLGILAMINTNPQKSVPIPAGNVAIDRSALSPEDKAKVAIDDILGVETNTKKPRVVSVKFTKYTPSQLKEYGYAPDAIVITAFIEINGSENLTSNLQKGTLTDEAEKVFKAVFASDPSIGDITLWSDLPLKDKYGNVKDDVAVIHSISRSVFEKINWANFNHRDLPILLKTEKNTDDRNGYVEKIAF